MRLLVVGLLTIATTSLAAPSTSEASSTGSPAQTTRPSVRRPEGSSGLGAHQWCADHAELAKLPSLAPSKRLPESPAVRGTEQEARGKRRLSEF